MIAIIADDFTGAAEIGGVGLKYGLKVVIETEVNDAPDADLMIIATDTRSMSAKEAEKEIETVTSDLLKLNPTYIFKKLDSVLRGNISNELFAQIKVSGLKRAIVVAGNPIFGRTIKHGFYAINSVPLDETHFVSDADFPVSSSNVLEIIKKEGQDVVSKSVTSSIPEKGIIVGDVTSHEDMLNWVSKIDMNTLAAGGSGFFDVILSTHFPKRDHIEKNVLEQGQETLFVFGSTFPKNNTNLERLTQTGVVKKNMPEEIYLNKTYNPLIFENWVCEVVESLKNKHITIVTVEHSNNNEAGLAIRMKKVVAELVRRVMQQIKLTNLFIEGGATTSEILRSLEITKLYPFIEIDLGIIQMKVDGYPDLKITTKPGSYIWPKDVYFENIIDKNTVSNG